MIQILMTGMVALKRGRLNSFSHVLGNPPFAQNAEMGYYSH